MKKMLFLLLLFVGSMAMTACDSDDVSISRGNGMVDSRAERRRRVAAIADVYDRQIQDDWDEIWFCDNNLHLTEWHVNIGN